MQSVDVSTIAWNFEVQFGKQPYLTSRKSCAKNQPILRGVGGNMAISFGLECPFAQCK